MSPVLLELQQVTVLRPTEPTGLFGLWGARPVRALDGVSLALGRGEALGIMGGSGSGKTTLLETATLKRPADRGRVIVQGQDVARLSGDDRRKVARKLQLIRQDARDSLPMEVTVRRAWRELLRHQGLPDDERRMAGALEQVGLSAGLLDRTPLEMSGGQQQRLALAAALLANPQLIAGDEPVSGVDEHLQLELIRLLNRIRRERQTALLIVSQHPRTISRLTERTAVLHAGHLVEMGTTERILADSLHPYSRRLLRPSADLLPPEEDLAGRTFGGCPWAAACGQAVERCRQERPALREVSAGHAVACHEV